MWSLSLNYLGNFYYNSEWQRLDLTSVTLPCGDLKQRSKQWGVRFGFPSSLKITSVLSVELSKDSRRQQSFNSSPCPLKKCQQLLVIICLVPCSHVYTMIPMHLSVA